MLGWGLAAQEVPGDGPDERCHAPEVEAGRPAERRAREEARTLQGDHVADPAARVDKGRCN